MLRVGTITPLPFSTRIPLEVDVVKGSIGTPMITVKVKKPKRKIRRCADCKHYRPREKGWFCRRTFLEMNKNLPKCPYYWKRSPKEQVKEEKVSNDTKKRFAAAVDKWEINRIEKQSKQKKNPSTNHI